jgi:hypothetical protein
MSIAGFILAIGIVTAFGIHHTKAISKSRLAAGNQVGVEATDSTYVLPKITKSADQKVPRSDRPNDTGKPVQKPADTAVTPHTDFVPSPAPPPSSPPESFDILGPSALSLGLGETVSVSFATNDASSVVWSGNGPEQNEIGANFSSTTGQGYTVSFAATDQAKVDTQVAFSIHVSDPVRGIDMDKTIVVTITK